MDRNCNFPPACPNTATGGTPQRPRASTMDCSVVQRRRRWQPPAQQNRNPCATPSWLNTSRPMAQQPGPTCPPPGPTCSPPGPTCPSPGPAPTAQPGRRRWSISSQQNPCSTPRWLNSTLPASQPSAPGCLNATLPSSQQCTPGRLNATLTAAQECTPARLNATVTAGQELGSTCPRSVSPMAQPGRRRWTLSGQQKPCNTPGWLNAARGTAQQPNPTCPSSPSPAAKPPSPTCPGGPSPAAQPPNPTCPSNSPPTAQPGRRRWSISSLKKPCSTPGWLNTTLPKLQPSTPGCPNTTLPVQQQCAPGPLNATLPTPQEGRRRWTISSQQKPDCTPAWLKSRQNACAAATESPPRTCNNQPNACGSPTSPNASPTCARTPQQMSSPCPATPQQMAQSRSPCPRTPVNTDQPATPRCARSSQRMFSPCPATPQQMAQSPPLFRTPSTIQRRPSPLFKTPSSVQRRPSPCPSTSYSTPQRSNRLCPETPTVQECSPRTPENTGRPVDQMYTSTPIQPRQGTPSTPSTPTCANVSREFLAPQRARASTLDCSVIPRITGRNIELNFELPPRQTGNRDAPCPRTSASQLRHIMRMQKARNMRENSSQRGCQNMSVGPRQSQSQFLAVPRPPRRRWGIPIRENQNCDGPSWINTLPIVQEGQQDFNHTMDCCPEREEMFDSC